MVVFSFSNGLCVQVREGKDLRWLSWDTCVKSVRRLLKSLLTYGRGNKNAVAAGNYKLMATYEFVATLYLMSDVLPLLTTLSTTFQADNVDLSIVQPAVQVPISCSYAIRVVQLTALRLVPVVV